MDNWSKIEFICAKNLHISPLVLYQMDYWSVEKILMNYEEFIEEENKQQNKQKLEHEKEFKQSSYSTPTMPKWDMPKFEMPKMPKF